MDETSAAPPGRVKRGKFVKKKYFKKEKKMGTTTPESRSCAAGYQMYIILHEGQRWFRAADVTRHLAYSNGREAVIRHVKQKDKTTNDFLVPGGDHSVYVNESGVRALIRRSRKAEADDFEAWVA